MIVEKLRDLLSLLDGQTPVFLEDHTGRVYRVAVEIRDGGIALFGTGVGHSWHDALRLAAA